MFLDLLLNVLQHAPKAADVIWNAPKVADVIWNAGRAFFGL